ncbi:MAG: hypothetical protein Q9169_006275 [Polycauliona sp. 2 TL-2023]
MTPLAEASRLGHVNMVKNLLAHQANVEIEHGEPQTILKHACCSGYPEIVQLLLDHGANPNTRLPGSDTALGVALSAEQPDLWPKSSADTLGLVKMLLEAGANIDDRFLGGSHIETSPIEFAVISYYEIPMIEILLEHGANAVDGFVASSERLRVNLCRFFLDRGVDINARASPDHLSNTYGERGWAGRTALERACVQVEPTVTHPLLENGADPNLRSPLAESALEAYMNRAVECQPSPIFLLLLKYGANLELVREDKLKLVGFPKWEKQLTRDARSNVSPKFFQDPRFTIFKF